MIVLKNLPENQKYEVEVSAWLKDRAEKTVFQKQEIELNNTLEEAFDICLSDEKVENLNEGTTVGTFTVNEMAPEGNYVFSLCTGEGDTHNPYFAIENGVLKTAKKLEEGKTYTIRLKAKNAEAEKEKIFKIYAVGRGLVFRKEDQKIAVGSPVELSTKDYAEKLMKLEEGTILVHYTSTSDQAIQSLFSVSNAKAGHENRHFHVYIRPEGVLGCEIRNESAMNYGFKAANAVKADYKGKPAENIIALQADKEKGTYQLFANGEKVLTVAAAALGGYRFISEITGLDTVSLGATKRGGINKYTFGGNIHKIEVYETPLTDEELIRRLRMGETGIIDYLMEKYKNLVRKEANAMYLLGGETDDLIQEGMIGLFKAVQDYDVDQEASFFSFARLCVTRQLYSAIEASNRKKHSPLNSYISLYEREDGVGSLIDMMESEHETNPEELLVSQEHAKSLEERLEKDLSELERRVLYLHLMGTDYKTIAKLLDRSPKTIDNALQRIKGKMQRILEKEK